jgi:ferredoxin
MPASLLRRRHRCHSCECALVGGQVSYSTEPLDPPSQGNALICCSMPVTDIELDL